MARSLYISGVGLQQRGAEAFRVVQGNGGLVHMKLIEQFVAAVRGHVHYEVATMANPKRVGVTGSWWLPTGTHAAAEWNKYGGSEALWWKPENGEPAEVVDRGTPIIRPSQIFWWISTESFEGLSPATKPGGVWNALNRVGSLPS